MLNIKL